MSCSCGRVVFMQLSMAFKIRRQGSEMRRLRNRILLTSEIQWRETFFKLPTVRAKLRMFW